MAVGLDKPVATGVSLKPVGKVAPATSDEHASRSAMGQTKVAIIPDLLEYNGS